MSSYTVPILCSKTQECKNYSNKCKECVRYSHYNILNKENKDMYKAKEYSIFQ